MGVSHTPAVEVRKQLPEGRIEDESWKISKSWSDAGGESGVKSISDSSGKNVLLQRALGSGWMGAVVQEQEGSREAEIASRAWAT